MLRHEQTREICREAAPWGTLCLHGFSCREHLLLLDSSGEQQARSRLRNCWLLSGLAAASVIGVLGILCRGATRAGEVSGPQHSERQRLEEVAWNVESDVAAVTGPRRGAAPASLVQAVAAEDAVVGVLGQAQPVPVSQPGRWLMCSGPGLCGNQSMQRWRLHPSTLLKVNDFSAPPGVQSSAFQTAAEKWLSSPPHFQGSAVLLADIGQFVEELLNSDPFGTGLEVPYVDLSATGKGGRVVAITQRQLAFLVANVMMGNTIPMGDGLSAALRRCSGNQRPRGLLFSLLSLLAVLSRELQGGSQGTMLIGTTPRTTDRAGTASDDAWRSRLWSQVLRPPTLCAAPGSASSSRCGISDLLAGGTPYQALTDAAGTTVGGHGRICDLTGKPQDDSLALFYGEVLAFSFFAAGNGGLIPAPFTLVGARRYMNGLEGEISLAAPYWSHCGYIPESNWLNQEITNPHVIVDVSLAGHRVPVVADAFVALSSTRTDDRFNSSTAFAAAGNAFGDDGSNVSLRRLDEDLSRWYQAHEPSMHNEAVEDALRKAVRRIGTGPWGAGRHRGDSQLYFLVVWLATSLLEGVSLDYYIYSRFCEDPGGQCLLLEHESCAVCIQSSQVPIPLPYCGSQGVHGIIRRFHGRSAAQLYEAAVRLASRPEHHRIFERIAGNSPSEILAHV